MRRLSTAVFLLVSLAFPQVLKAQGSKQVLIKRVEKIINLDPPEVLKPNMKDVTFDTSLFDLIDIMAFAGKLAIYDSEGHALVYSTDVARPDTQTITDPVTQREEIKTINHHYYWGSTHPLYSIIQTWRMDLSSGHISVNIDMIAPVFIGPAQGNFPAYHDHPYWLKYEDVKDLIAKYEHNHITAPVMEQIWNGYFYCVPTEQISK